MNFDFLQNIQWTQIPAYLYLLFGVFVLCAFVQLYYYWWPFWSVARARSSSEQVKRTPVSVVICAKNEVQNLEKNLPLFLAQDYPEFEVVVVNDGSTDDTEEMLHALRQQHKNLQVTTIEPDYKFTHNKKLAITVGIKAAQHKRIIFTEPDCEPSGSRWLEAMQQAFGGSGEVVIGYCRNTHRNNAIEKMQRSDELMSALFALRGAMLGKAYRSTIKNMGLSQEFFFRSKGFAHYNSQPNGEETIFLCRNANEQNTKVALAPEALISSSLELTPAQWFKQKCQYAALLTMGKRGVGRIRAEMFSRSLFYLCAMALPVIAIIRHDYFMLPGIAPLMLARLVSRLVVMKKVLLKLQEKDLFWWVLAYDFISPLLALAVTLLQPNLQKIKKIK